MRTSGPCLPSGRRSASTTSGGSPPGSGSSRRISFGHGQGVAVRRLGASAPARGLVHEQHVGVAAVAQLVAAEAAHGRPPRTGWAPRRPAAARAPRRPPRAGWPRSGGVGDPREPGARRRRRRRARRGRRRPCGTARGGARRGPRAPASPTSFCRPAAASISSVDRLGGERRAGRRRGSARPAARASSVGGVARRRQHAREVLGGRALVAQHPQVPGGAAERVADLAEAEQPGVGVGGVGEPVQQHRQQGALDGGLAADAGGQRLEVAQRGRRGRRSRARPAGRRRPRARAGPRRSGSCATAASSGR